jgi:hypothetical protein
MRTLLVAAGVMTNQGKVQSLREVPLEGFSRNFRGQVEREEPRRPCEGFPEELGIEVEVGRILEVVFHVYPEYPILLLAYRCRIEKGCPQPLGCREVRWVPIEELVKLPLAQADAPIREALCISEGGA